MALLSFALFLLVLVLTIAHGLLKFSDDLIFGENVLVMLLIPSIKCLKVLLLLASKFAVQIFDFLLQSINIFHELILQDLVVLSVLFHLLGSRCDCNSQVLSLLLDLFDHGKVLGLVLLQVVKYL